MRGRVITLTFEQMGARLSIPAIVVCCFLIGLIDGVSMGSEPVVKGDNGPSSAVLSRIQTTLERGDLEGFLALSITPPAAQLGLLRTLFGDSAAPTVVWESNEPNGETSEVDEQQRDGASAKSSGGANQADSSAMRPQWLQGLKVPDGGRTCVRSLELDGVYPLSVQRNVKETDVSVAQYGLLFQDERLKQVLFQSRVGGVCEGQTYRLLLVLIGGDWRIVPGSILEATMKQVEVPSTTRVPPGSLVDSLPRSCRLAWHLKSSETCSSIDALLRDCEFRWGSGGEVTDPHLCSTDWSAMLGAMHSRLKEISCLVQHRSLEREGIRVAGQESGIPHVVVPGASGKVEGKPKGDGTYRDRDADVRPPCVMGYDAGSFTFLDSTVAQVELFVAVRGIGADDCRVEHWAILWIRSGDEWLPI